MAKPKIYLYAEALMHIRQLTLHASLETDKNEHTEVLISSDKHIITVLHDGESSSIYLPTQISGTANVTFPFEKKTEISIRLQIDDTEELKATSDDSSGLEVPWCAVDLSEKTSLRCKKCSIELLHTGRVKGWKDLPSDHWADLMDVWFCHKPHEGHSPDAHAAEAKGFSANSKIEAHVGVGLVDVVSFVLHRDDCSNLQVSCRHVIAFSERSHGGKERDFSISFTRVLLIQFLIQLPHSKFSSTTLYKVAASCDKMAGRLQTRHKPPISS